MKRFLFTLFFPVALAGLFPSGSFAKVTAEVKIGIDGHVVRDLWIPLEYTILEPPGREINGHLVMRNIGMDYMGNIQVLNSFTHSVAITKDATFPFSIKYPVIIERDSYYLQFELLDKGDVVDSRVLKLIEYDPNRQSGYMVVVGAPDEVFHIINYVFPKAEIVPLEPDELPQDGVYLDGIKGIVLDNCTLDAFTDKAWNSIIDYLGWGGRIILTPDLVRANLKSPRLVDLMPLEYLGDKIASDPAAIEKYIHERIDPEEGSDEKDKKAARRLASASILDVRAPGSIVRFANEGVPVLIERNYGLGSIWLFTIDANKSLFEGGDKEKSEFVKDLWKLLTFKIGHFINWDYDQRLVTPSQARVDDLVKFIIWYAVILFIVLGPVNYFLLKKLDRREFILITVPLIAAAFSVSAYLIGYNQRGGRTIVMLKHLLVGRANDPVMGAMEYMGILGAQSDPITITASFQEGRGITSEERTSRGENRTYIPSYQHMMDRVKISDLKLAKWSMYFASAWATVKYNEGIEADIKLNGRLLSGRVVNHLDFALDDCYVIYNGGITSLGRIEPEQELDWSLHVPHPKAKYLSCRGRACIPDLESKFESDEKYLMYSDAVSHLGSLSYEPILVGWTEGPGPIKVEIDGDGKFLEETGMVIVKMPLILHGGTITIEPGISIASMRPDRQLMVDEFKSMRESSRIIRDTDFAQAGRDLLVNITMPLCVNDPVETESLELFFGRNKPRPDRKAESDMKIAYYLWDWDENLWKRVHVSDRIEGSVEVEDPGVFIRLPEGLIRAYAKVHEGPETEEAKTVSGRDSRERSMSAISRIRPRSVDLKYIDVRYEAKVRSIN